GVGRGAWGWRTVAREQWPVNAKPGDRGGRKAPEQSQFAWVLVVDRLLLRTNQGGIERKNEPIYERPVVKRGGADFVSQGSRTSPSPSASVDLAHLRPVRRRFSVHPATHPLSPRPRESFLPQCRQCTKR